MGTACRTICLAAAAWMATGLSNGQAAAPASYMYILMLNMVGPPANSLWETLASESLSDADWQRMKDMVARLDESAAMISSGGTSAAEIERAKSSEWMTWAGRFASSASAATRAVESRDRMALLAASDALLEACEGCHMAFPSTAR